MNGVIEILGGDFKNIKCTACISKKYALDNRTVSASLLDKDCFIYVSESVADLNLKNAISPSYESFLRLMIKSPLANIDSVKSNVPIKITATFGVFGWIGFYLFRMYKKLKVVK